MSNSPDVYKPHFIDFDISKLELVASDDADIIFLNTHVNIIEEYKYNDLSI